MRAVRIPASPIRLEIQRDDAGVPHIEADDLSGALFGLGYMHAVDRGTQVLFARSMALGRACEEIADSPELADTDRFFRRMGLFLDCEQEYAAFPSDLQRLVEAYCQGVNHGIQHAGRTLPMWATGFEPAPWDGPSVMLIGKLLSFGGLAVSQMQNERLLIELIHAGVSEVALRDLFGDRIREADFDLIRQIRMANPLSDDALEVLSDLPRLAGSNAWAVSPSRSASGHALLASDPHLEINRLPAIWYEAAIRYGDDYALGATLPGCPLFAVARNRHLAWGVTYMKGDTVDYFMEDCRRGGQTGWQYRRLGEWHDFRLREETVHHKGAEEPETVRVWWNDQGVLEGDLEEPGIHLSIAWSGMYEGNGRAIGTWIELLQCRSVREGMEVVARCPQPTLCWVFADREGHIGLQGNGRFPLRSSGYQGLVPIPAWDPANHWQGWRRAPLPSQYDPECGFVATANEEQNPDDGPPLMTQPLPDYRKRRIVERLSQIPQATLQHMRELQYDVVSVRARELLQTLLPMVPPSPEKEALANWDGNYRPESTEPSLFLQFYRSLLVELLGHAHGIGWRRMLYLCSRSGFSVMVITAADRLLLRERSVWWADRGKEATVRAAFGRVRLERAVPWSEVNNFHFTDRFFGQHRVGRMLGYRSRRIAMPGNHATVFQGHVLQTATREFTFAPSYHFVTDLGTDEAWTNLPGGPSESRFSRYYRSDVARWIQGEYKRMAPDGDS